MRLLYAGTPDIAVPSLRALAAADGHEVVGVLTAPDKVSGRGRRVQPPPVKAAALELGLNVLQPERLGAAAREQIAPLAADLLVVFAYGRIFGPRFLGMFPEGGINMHPSALPKHRGPAPITAAILEGDVQTALSVQRIALEMDAGDILRQSPFPLDGSETAGSLTSAVADAAAPELVAAVDTLAGGHAIGIPQNHEDATWCSLVSKEDGRVDWTEPAEVIERKIRAYDPWPKARTVWDGDGLALLKARVAENQGANQPEAVPGTVLGVDRSEGILIQTGKGVLGVTRLQLASRKPLDFQPFLNGVALKEGMQLGEIHES